MAIWSFECRYGYGMKEKNQQLDDSSEKCIFEYICSMGLLVDVDGT
jgi:hypothetical protein